MNKPVKWLVMLLEVLAITPATLFYSAGAVFFLIACIATRNDVDRSAVMSTHISAVSGIFGYIRILSAPIGSFGLWLAVLSRGQIVVWAALLFGIVAAIPFALAATFQRNLPTNDALAWLTTVSLWLSIFIALRYILDIAVIRKQIFRHLISRAD